MIALILILLMTGVSVSPVSFHTPASRFAPPVEMIMMEL
jgi:hypothetical protein